MNESPPQNSPSVFEYVQKASNYLIGLTLILYLAGFAVTNLYLGSLGIINLDILKSRYILAGFLFVIFLSCIAFLIYGLLDTLKKYADASMSLIIMIFNDFIFNFSAVYILIKALDIFSGISGNLPVGIPHLSSPVPWSTWLTTMPLRAFSAAFNGFVIIFLLFASIFILVFIAWVLINPRNKEGVRESRKTLVKNFFLWVWHAKIKIPLYLFVGFLIISAIVLITSFIHFVTTNQLSLSNSYNLPEGWVRFLVTIAVIYALLAVLITFRYKVDSRKILPFLNPFTPFENMSNTIYLAVTFITLVLPMYALGVYPNIPQQIGGGQVVRVEVSISNDTLQSSLNAANTEVYLIDRASNNVLFLVTNPSENKVVEVSSDLIHSITYKPFP